MAHRGIIASIVGCIVGLTLAVLAVGPIEALRHRAVAQTAPSACCIAVDWRFITNNEPAVIPGETVSFRLTIDNTQVTTFDKNIVANAPADLHYVTYIPTAMFFHHNVTATMHRSNSTNAACLPTLLNGFTPVNP